MRALRGRRAERVAPHELGGSTTRRRRAGSSTISIAIAAIRRRSWRTVVSRKVSHPAIAMSSKPTTLTSPGTRSPSMRQASSAPSAMTSLPHMRAVGRVARSPASRSSPASRPVANANGPRRTQSAGQGELGAHAELAVAAGARVGRPEHRGDPLMPRRVQRARQQAGALDVVDRARRVVAVVQDAVEEHEREPRACSSAGACASRCVAVRTAPSIDPSTRWSNVCRAGCAGGSSARRRA